MFRGGVVKFAILIGLDVDKTATTDQSEVYKGMETIGSEINRAKAQPMERTRDYELERKRSPILMRLFYSLPGTIRVSRCSSITTCWMVLRWRGIPTYRTTNLFPSFLQTS
jgi:hypothetical protein